jgi:hypothetical protein
MMVGQVDTAALVVFCDRGNEEGGKEKAMQQNS